MRAKDSIDFKKLRRILVIRLSSLGDILLTTPLLRLLRTQCPEAQIDVLVKAQYQDLLRVHPGVTQLLTFESQSSLFQMVRTLRGTFYDMALDLHGTLRSRLLLQGIRAHYKLGYNKRVLRRALLVHLGWNTLKGMTPVPELYAAPLRRRGLTEPLAGLEMYLEVKSVEAMRTYVTQSFPDTPPLLALAPGARWPTKRWPVERFAVVAQEMAREMKAAIVILGGKEEVPLAQELCRRLSDNNVRVLNNTGQLSLMYTAALLQYCRVLLSNDSGLMHMATALQVPVVAIFGPTVQEFGFYPFQARAAQVVSTPLPCRPCTTKGSQSCPKSHHGCMEYIPSERVLDLVRTMWEA